MPKYKGYEIEIEGSPAPRGNVWGRDVIGRRDSRVYIGKSLSDEREGTVESYDRLGRKDSSVKGSYSAYCPNLLGVVAAAETKEELLVLMRGAIDLHLEGIAEDELEENRHSTA